MDYWNNHETSLTDPATRHFLIAPSDTENLPVVPRRIYCEADGTIVIVDETDVALPYPMLAGDVLDFGAERVLANGPTGTFYGQY